MNVGAEVAERVESVRLRNARAVELPLYLEPWGEEYALAPNAALDIVAEGPAGDSLEVELGADHITVYGWSGSVVTLFQEGIEIGAGLGRRTPVPPLPQCVEG